MAISGKFHWTLLNKLLHDPAEQIILEHFRRLRLWPRPEDTWDPQPDTVRLLVKMWAARVIMYGRIHRHYDPHIVQVIRRLLRVSISCAKGKIRDITARGHWPPARKYGDPA